MRNKWIIIGFFSCIFGLGLISQPAQAGTGVIVNGRALSVPQLIAVSRALGYVPNPGYYWYDPRTGNYGRVGNGGSGGDRFWSTSYGAGNSTSDNSQGYVSVPGYGPVSYGM